MSDPYKVLGIDRSASDDEVKKAYRDLARKYHPDKNPGNQAAEDMFKIVQEAYTQVMDERKNGGRTDSGNGSSGYSGSYGGSQGQAYYGPAENAARYQAAVNYINNGYFREAVNVLMNVTERDAMWYYLSALSNAGLGNNYMAMQQARTAAEMEPDNAMYQELLRRMAGGGIRYSARHQAMNEGSMVDGDFCTRLCAFNLCLNLCCDAMICC